MHRPKDCVRQNENYSSHKSMYTCKHTTGPSFSFPLNGQRLPYVASLFFFFLPVFITAEERPLHAHEETKRENKTYGGERKFELCIQNI